MLLLFVSYFVSRNYRAFREKKRVGRLATLFLYNCLVGKSFTLKIHNSAKAFTSSEPPLCLQNRVNTLFLYQAEICTVTVYYNIIYYYTKGSV